jgi:hypothetical protein
MNPLRWWRRALRRLSGWHLFAFIAVMWSIGAAPVFVAFFATNGVRASSIVLVTFTWVVLLCLARGIAAAGDAVKRHLLRRDDDDAVA